MANTVIQLKYSNITSAPTSLSVGEPAYSFVSDKLFIGNTTTGVITIGGKYYTDIIDAASSSSTPSVLVLRDSDSNIYANTIYANVVGSIQGTAATADKLTTARDIGLSGDVTGNVSFDGSQNVTLTVDLSDTGVSAGTYGGVTSIPVFTVDTEGRLTTASNVSISTTLQVAGDSGTASIPSSETLTINGRDGITTLAVDSNNSILIDVDNTVIRTTGNQSITGDFTISGNLNVQGNTVTYGVETFVVDDPIILLANNNVGNIVDIGFTGQYFANSETRYTGLVKDVSEDKYYLFDNYTGQVQDDHILNPNDASFRLANLEVNIVGGTISGLDADLSVSDGGTGASSFSAGQILIGNGTGALLSLANTGTAGTYANASHVPVITTDAWGRVSGVTNTAIAISTSQVTSGILSIARGGTNNDTYSSGQRVIYDGTKLATQANTSTTVTGVLSTSNTITDLTYNSYGEVTGITAQPIALAASQITSGILGVERGGSGAGTFTTNSVLLGNGTSAFNTAFSSTEGHILTINSSGVPTFSMLSGGTF